MTGNKLYKETIRFFKEWKELIDHNPPDLLAITYSMVNSKYLINMHCIQIATIIKEKGFPIKSYQEVAFMEKVKESVDEFVKMSRMSGLIINKVNWLEFCNDYFENFCGLLSREAIECVNHNSQYIGAHIEDQSIIIDIL
jgi:hypothetical protein